MQHRQRASALLTALFITAIAVIMTTAVIYKFRLLVHLATLNNESNQSSLYLTGVLYQVQSNVDDYANNWAQTPTQNSPSLTLPSHIGPQKFETVSLEASIVDGQGLYNINNLTSANEALHFIQLMKYAIPTLSPEKDLAITEAIINWLQPGNTMDALYARYTPPYRAAHRPMQDISELRWVAGVTPQIYTALQPYIIALPANHAGVGNATAININTAMPAVLLTVSNEMDINKAQSLYECRRAHGVFFSIEDYNKTCVAPLGLGTLNNITTHSSYFLVRGSATSDTQQVLLSSLLGLQQNTKVLRSYIVWQTSG